MNILRKQMIKLVAWMNILGDRFEK